MSFVLGDLLLMSAENYSRADLVWDVCKKSETSCDKYIHCDKYTKLSKLIRKDNPARKNIKKSKITNGES